MDNHYHLFIETPEANLVVGMKWLQNAYTRRFNTRHKEWGRLFGDRYKSSAVEGRKGEYYASQADYIHLNPGACRVDQAEGGRRPAGLPVEQPRVGVRAAANQAAHVAGGGARAGGDGVREHGGRSPARLVRIAQSCPLSLEPSFTEGHSCTAGAS